jgi:predicted aldo/keto reductase-like oxidoreductase
MNSVILGKTGLKVPRVGFGGIPIQRLSEAEAVEVVQRCLDLGVTFLDTANAYSTSESRIGKAISGRREELVVATKTAGRDRATAEQHLQLSLTRLACSTIDLWQFHNVSSFETYEQVLAPGGAMEAALAAKRQGTIRHIGITSHDMDVALRAVASGHFETIQFPFNFVSSDPDRELVPLAAEHNVGFIAMKPLGGGLLDDATLALKYLLQFDSVLPIPGIQQVEEVEQVVGILDGPWGLTPQEQAALERIREEVGKRFCRRCEYCQPCPEGVVIPLILNPLSFWRRFPADELLTGEYAEIVQGARDCVQCGECEEKCPYGLPICEMLVESLQFWDTVCVAS